MKSLLIFTIASSVAAPALAQTTTPSTAPATQRANGVVIPNGHITTQPGGGLLLNFKDASIDSVLDELSAVAGFIVVKETPPQGRVTLVSKQPVNSKEAVSLLNTVLNNAGYAAVQQGRILKVMKRDAARHANIPVHSGNDPKDIEPTDELITQVIPLRYADAPQLKTDLQVLVGTDDFTANATTNSLVITDTSANIRRLVEIIAAMDSKMADAAAVKVFQLKFASASGAAKLINDLFGDAARRSGTGQESSRFGFFGGGFPGFPGGSDSRGGSSSSSGGRSGGTQQRQPARVVASSDDRTNTVVVAGPDEILNVIAGVIKELDANPVAEESVFVYKLKNGQALSIESTINLLFNGTSGTNRGTSGLQSSRSGVLSSGIRSGTSGSTSSRGGFGGSTGGFGSSTFGGSSGFGSSGFGGSGLSGSFGSSSTGSSRFGSGGYSPFGGTFGGGSGLSSSTMQNASDLAGQVSIIADPDTNTLLVRTAPKNFERVKQILDELDRPVAQVLIKVLVAEVTHTKALDLGAEFSVLNLRAGGDLGQRGGTNFGIPVNGTGAVVQILENDFTATIRALETTGKLDVLSRPYILASDNQLASITVGQRVPFVTNSRITELGQTLNTITYDDIGILLDVIPHINPDGLVIMDVVPTISALTGDTIPISDNADAPIIAKRSAQSRVAVQNGKTVVIGGLMEDRKTETIDKVPLLGDIPILGEAFKRRRVSKAKTELLIFLTPHVAARPDVLRPMSQDELDGAKLTPKAVDPGVFDEHMQGMERGATTQPEPLVAPPVDKK